MFSGELQQKYPCFFRKDVVILKLNVVLLDMVHLLSVANKSNLSLDNHIKTKKDNQAIEDEASSSTKVT